MFDTRFAAHNAHLEESEDFERIDPHLRNLRRQRLGYRFPILDALPYRKPGVYSITGGRQVGKSTVLKQWMADMLRNGARPTAMVYFTGELIDDHHALVRLIGDFVKDAPDGEMVHVLLDEVTYIRDWDKGVKFLADSGTLENVVLVLTGSDSTIIREARMRFPGRRGTSATVDFHLFPLTFHEFVVLKQRLTASDMARLMTDEGDIPDGLRVAMTETFDRYLMHGGYLRAVNNMEETGSIAASTFAVYCDWIRGDMLKRGKSELYLREILGAIVKRDGSQVTWNNLAKDLSIDHPTTVSDYIGLLASMDAVFVQSALLEDKLIGAPKKAKKVMFCDPFIRHAVRSWLERVEDPFHEQVTPLVSDPECCGRLVENCVVTHVRRFHPTFYIKAEGEVDVAYVSNRRFWPVEAKWTRQLRAKELKQIAKYKNGRIWSRSWETKEIMGIPVLPIPLALFRLGASPLTIEI